MDNELKDWFIKYDMLGVNTSGVVVQMLESPKRSVLVKLDDSFRQLDEVILPPVDIIGNNSINHERNSKKIRINEKTYLLNKFAFSNSDILEVVTGGDNIICIDYGCFSMCSNLRSFYFGKSLKKIKDNAFSGCENLEDIILPEGLKEIGDYAFNNVGSIGTLHIPKSVQKIGSMAFRNVSPKRIEVPKRLVKGLESIKLRSYGIDMSDIEVVVPLG